MQGSDLYSPREPCLPLPLNLSLSGLGRELRAVCRPKEYLPRRVDNSLKVEEGDEN